MLIKPPHRHDKYLSSQKDFYAEKTSSTVEITSEVNEKMLMWKAKQFECSVFKPQNNENRLIEVTDKEEIASVTSGTTKMVVECSKPTHAKFKTKNHEIKQGSNSKRNINYIECGHCRVNKKRRLEKYCEEEKEIQTHEYDNSQEVPYQAGKLWNEQPTKSTQKCHTVSTPLFSKKYTQPMRKSIVDEI